VRKIVREVVGVQIDPIKKNALRLLEDKKYDDALEESEKIFSIRIVDPACGSGSFLLAAHAYIAEALREYNDRARDILSASRTTASAVTMFSAPTPQSQPMVVSRPEERALVNCIYGVDLDSQAVGLAKLALWTQ